MLWKEILGLLLDVIRKILDRINDYWTGKKYSDAQDNLNNKDNTVDNVINSILQNTCTCSKQFSEADTTCRVHQRSFICAKLDKRSIENYQPVRIQIGDGKEAMIYPIIPDWHTVSISTPITGKSRCYIRIPSFSFNDIDTTRDSYVRLQYNYSADKDFTIGKIPKVIGSGVVLCIRYRVGDNIFRWKLWEDELFTQNIPLYNGEVIKKNFVIEVWTLKGVSSIGIGSDLLINTTIRRDSISIGDINYENNSITSITVFENIKQSPDLINDQEIGNLVYEWNPSNNVKTGDRVTAIKTAIPSISGVNDIYTTGNGLLYNEADPDFNGSPSLLADLGGLLMSTVTMKPDIPFLNDYYYDVIGIIIKSKKETITSDWYYSFHNCFVIHNHAVNTLEINWRGKSENCVFNNIDLKKETIILCGITYNSTGELVEERPSSGAGEVYVINGTNDYYYNIGDCDLTAAIETPYTDRIMLTYYDGAVPIKIGGIVAYRSRIGMLGSIAIPYAIKYCGYNQLPLTFNEGIAWLDNEN